MTYNLTNATDEFNTTLPTFITSSSTSRVLTIQSNEATVAGSWFNNSGVYEIESQRMYYFKLKG